MIANATTTPVSSATRNIETVTTSDQGNKVKVTVEFSTAVERAKPVEKTALETVIEDTVNLIKGITSTLISGIIAASAQPEEKPQASIPTTSTPAQATPPTATTATPPANTGTPRKNESLESFLMRELEPNAQGNFDEEKLQHGITSYLLNEKSLELYSSYKAQVKAYEDQAGSRASYEDAVKYGLKQLVSRKELTKADAELIAGQSFRAAQLDNDIKNLFDDKGGAGDSTVAVMSAKEAAERSNGILGRVRREEVAAPSRDLNIASNTAAVAKTAPKQNSSSESSQGFLWKPVSESDGKLVVLVPENLSKDVSSVSIHQVDKNGKKKLIESGKNSGIANGDRAHFRFKQPGSKYPDGVTVEIKLKNGKIISEVIKDTAARVEK